MILGLGTDIVDCVRVKQIREKHSGRFLSNILTGTELALASERNGMDEFIAGRWAAKEAFSKALGCGISPDCSFVEIQILPNPQGRPEITLFGETLAATKRCGVQRIHLSISHERCYATAVVILED